MARERYLKQLDLLKESVISFGKIVELVFSDSMIAVIDLDVKLDERILALRACLKIKFDSTFGIKYCPICSTSLTGSENHLASFRFQNTFLLNV